MEDARSFATNLVGASIGLLGVALVLTAFAVILARGSVFLGFAVGFAGLLVLVAGGAFLLVPTKVDELAETQSVRVEEKDE
ncbi:MAG TPA: hypothetical protein VI997_05515 [Candidatus Thermoplasmatota archaeon]|nr:hypothetical protein [Candidatus Thermoplasmatota archaeon]